MKNLQRVADNNFDRFQARSGLTTKNQSQMTKLIPILQLGSKNGPTEEQAKANLEKRIHTLKSLRTALIKANLKVADLYLADTDTQLTRLTSARKSMQKIAEEKLPIGVSSHIKACLNELTCLREGVFMGTATTKKSLAIIAGANAVARVDELLKNTRTKLLAKTQVAASEDQYLSEVEKVLEKTQKESKNISDLHKRSFVITRVPVIPIARGPINIQRLNSSGIKTDTIGGYPVLHNQMVIGVNKSFLNLKESEEYKSLDPERVREAAQKILDSISKSTKQKLHFVDSRPYGAQGGAWFWVMPDRQLNMFAKSLPGNSLRLTSWGFAF